MSKVIFEFPNDEARDAFIKEPYNAAKIRTKIVKPQGPYDASTPKANDVARILKKRFKNKEKQNGLI